VVPVFELSDGEVKLLRERLLAAAYTVDGVRKRLGPLAHAALHRNETFVGLRATDDNSALSTMIRLWLLQAPVDVQSVEDAFGRDLLEALVDHKILHRYGNDVIALVDVRPYGSMGDPAKQTEQDLWLIADLTPGMDGGEATVPADHVLGLNSAATTLAQLTVRHPVARALDLGTGCGVQAVHLASHAETVVGTDINDRALAMAALTARLNGVKVELRNGHLFEPVRDETFDLIVSNPPFVISPRSELIYRDGGMGGDELVRRFVIEAPRHLVDGGVCQLLANWMHVRGEQWDDRLRGWLLRSGCDAWIVQREVSDPGEYIELWLKDAGLHGSPVYRERYEEWLEWFDMQLVEQIGFGWITLRKTSGKPVVRIEDWPHAVEQPLGPAIAQWFSDVDWLRAHSDEVLWETKLVVAESIEQEMIGEPGARHPSRIVLRQYRGLRRAATMDTAEAGFVGACDGEMTVGQIVGAVADLLSQDAGELREQLLPRVRELILEGYLRVPDPEEGSMERLLQG
jgi:methylase of polypeptide subunit release factors